MGTKHIESKKIIHYIILLVLLVSISIAILYSNRHSNDTSIPYDEEEEIQDKKEEVVHHKNISINTTEEKENNETLEEDMKNKTTGKKKYSDGGTKINDTKGITDERKDTKVSGDEPESEEEEEKDPEKEEIVHKPVPKEEYSEDPDEYSYVHFNQCLADRGLVIFCRGTCSGCENLLKDLGGYDSAKPVYIDCNKEENEKRCDEEANEGYIPEVHFGNEIYQGVKSPEGFSEATGCPLP